MHKNIPCHRLLGWVALASMLQSCGEPKSSSTGGPEGAPVATNKMTIALTVESKNATSAVVSATLNDGKIFGSSYRLDGGDSFRACISGVCRNMEVNSSIDSPDYNASFTFQPGVDYVVSFNRQQGQSAPNSRVALPQAFTIVTPANKQQVTDGDMVLVSWSPASTAPAVASLWYDMECPTSSSSSFIGTGTLSSDENADGRETVSIDTLVSRARSNGNSISRCSIDITVRHQLQGQVDPAFDGGTALGIVSRKVSLSYVAR